MKAAVLATRVLEISFQMKALLAGALLLLAMPCAHALEPAYTLNFHPGPGLKKDKRVVRILPHPCGDVVVARVNAMPPLDTQGALKPGRAVEVASGQVVNRWPIPVDSFPVEVKGMRLLVEYEGKRYWITPDGSIVKGDSAASGAPPAAVECGLDLRPEFGQTVADPPFNQCQAFIDPDSGKTRLLADDGACS